MAERLILNLSDLRKKRGKKRTATAVPCPELGTGAICYVLSPVPRDRDLSEMQWLAFRKATGIVGTVGFRQYLAAWCVCDEHNKRLIHSGDNEDEISDEFIDAQNDMANELPMAVIIRLYDVAHKNMGLSTTDVEALVKNLQTTRTADGNGLKRKRSGKHARNGSTTSKTPKN